MEELGRFPNGHPLAGSARADVDLDVLDDLQIFETAIAPWSDGSDDRYAEALVAVYLTAGRGLIPRRGDWLPGTAWDMSDLAPLSVAERCEPAPEDATFTHVCG